ncbi:MAG: sodium:proton antiporter [Candidatus Marinimicrobia bacterium]|nr:sodium:proton antiporter [Candidatus Neomarinimicrobiota bacterium]
MKTKNILFIYLLCSSIFASSGNLGEDLPLFSIVPFIGILFSIAVVPLVAPIFWHRNFGKISAFWAISFLLPFIIWRGFDEAFHQFLHVILLEYIPFILLLLALFTISGGIRLKGYLAGTPKINTLILFIGTALASWMGTTGAAMLLVRPILRSNKNRKNKIHTIIFFIFLVANIGGSLTPLGDPPLFLGFLHGVNFFWTTKALFVPMLVSSLILLIVYFLLDTYYYKRENHSVNEDQYKEPLSIEGKGNFILLVGVIIAVLLSGFWKPEFSGISLHGIHLTIPNTMRDISLVLLTLLSWKFTDLNIRNQNGFTWFPILEVAKLFAGIFITIIPAIAILSAGQNGVMSSVIQLVTDDTGNPVNYMYFWLTGLLSGFLDNAPTYLVFFNIAGSSTPEGMGIADYLTHGIPGTLTAISLGAVFMGAMTYIGNAPNFMVKSIAEENDIPMPSFFGFMLWSILILIPVFMIVSLTMI